MQYKIVLDLFLSNLWIIGASGVASHDRANEILANKSKAEDSALR